MSCDPADLMRKARRSKAWPSGQRHRRRERESPSRRGDRGAILIQNDIEPILQFTCRDSNRIALQSDLLGAAAFGVRNLLLLKGDDPKAGDQPDAKPVFDYDTVALTKAAVAIRDKGETAVRPQGLGQADFFIGAADVPIDPPAGWEPKSLKAQDRRRLRVRANPVLHGCRRGAALHGAACPEHGVGGSPLPDRRGRRCAGPVGALDA